MMETKLATAPVHFDSKSHITLRNDVRGEAPKTKLRGVAQRCLEAMQFLEPNQRDFFALVVRPRPLMGEAPGELGASQ